MYHADSSQLGSTWGTWKVDRSETCSNQAWHRRFKSLQHTPVHKLCSLVCSVGETKNCCSLSPMIGLTAGMPRSAALGRGLGGPMEGCRPLQRLPTRPLRHRCTCHIAPTAAAKHAAAAAGPAAAAAAQHSWHHATGVPFLEQLRSLSLPAAAVRCASVSRVLICLQASGGAARCSTGCSHRNCLAPRCSWIRLGAGHCIHIHRGGAGQQTAASGGHQSEAGEAVGSGSRGRGGHLRGRCRGPWRRWLHGSFSNG